MVKAKTQNDPKPADLGYAMPAEWEPHEATWLSWPHNESDWPDKLDTIRWVYAEMVRKISAGEQVRMLVGSPAEAKFASSYLQRAGCNLKGVEFVVHPTNRGWTRDSGPIFVRGEHRTSNIEHRTSNEGTAIVHFHFNAWAKYRNWQLDTRVPETAAKLLKKELFNAEFNGKPFVLEGGGIEVNGRGTLLTTEECYQHPTVQVRNPGMTKAQYDEQFKKYLGVKNVLWLAAGPVGDDTHGHIDDICRFVNPKTLVLIQETDPHDPNYRPLAENWERVPDLRLEDGSKPEVIALPMPAPLHYGDWRLPASYANFYICNACVIVPTFNDPNDRVALGILGELFQDRPVVGIHAVDLVLGFGSLHCLTQQQPAPLGEKGRPPLALDRNADYVEAKRCDSVGSNGQPMNTTKANSTKDKIKILLVDDHPVVRKGLHSLLAARENLKVVGEAADGAEALAKVKALQPDVVLLDLNMPGMDGLTVTETLRKDSPQAKVLVLSMHSQRDYVLRIIKAGARGYVLKDAPTDELLRAIQAVHAGDGFFSPAIARTALNQFVSEADQREPVARLSARERQVLTQIAEGMSNKQIAAALGVGVRTIETHRERTMTKLNIHNVAGLTRFAIAHGLISMDSEKTG